jgi:hypothetical protein
MWSFILIAAIIAIPITLLIAHLFPGREQRLEKDLKISEKAFSITEFEFEGKKYRKGMQLQLITDDGGCRGKLIGRNDVAICIEDGEMIACICFDMIETIKVLKDE